ncbi:TMEM43 family protein [Thalassospira alkalitolerans]|uniref:TMEM43 family protein n=1 Tax=Thalassospira alkalitolerans TaxID=1293890 RepID=UPI003AA915EA
MKNFTQTTNVEFGPRVKKAFKDVGLGVALIGFALMGIFWNEGNSVKEVRALDEGAGVVVPLTDLTPSAENEGALVHINGSLALDRKLADTVLGIEGDAQTVRLERKVEQFAWIEETHTSTKTNAGGSQDRTTNYTYRMAWTDSPESGASFYVSEGHENPPAPIRSNTRRHKTGQIGGFMVSEGVGDLGGSEQMILTQRQADVITAALNPGRAAHLIAGVVQFSEDIHDPQLGDLRISYFTSDIEEASAVGKQDQGMLVPYMAQNGTTVFLLEEGLQPADQMFETAQAVSRHKTWVFRVLLLAMMFIGFKALLSIVDVLASAVPALGWLTSKLTTLIAVTLTVLIGGGVMAIAWLLVRPLVSGAILIGVLALAAVVGAQVRRKAQTTPSQSL